MAFVYIGLGSNIGDRVDNLNKAARSLKADYAIELVKKSSVKETVPVDYLEQPDFMNQVILVRTESTPENLLIILKEIEAKLGRRPTVARGPRIIDLDILLYDDQIINTHKLKIPHPEITKRRFILDHLIELNPDIVDPVSGKKFREFIS